MSPLTASGKVLLVAAPGQAAEAAKQQLVGGGATVDVVDAAALGSLSAEDAYNSAVALVAAPLGHDSGLPALLRSLVKGGSLAQLLPADADASSAQLELTLSGFVDVVAAPAPVAHDFGSFLQVAAAKPAWAAGAAAKVVLRKKAAPAPPAAAATAGVIVSGPGKSWLAGAGGDAASGDLVDEDSLLAADPLPVVKPSDAGGCETKKRACKDCSCGRKEQEDAADGAVVAAAAASLAAGTFKSSCGNCWKGDAFRCGGCPYLGKPAFRPGTDGAVLLDATDDI